MKFQVNQKVIALTDSFNHLSQPRIKGNLYTVTKLSWCAGCGANLVNINNAKATDNPTCQCDCGSVQQNMGLHWSYSHNFAPLTEESMEALAEAEDYELAAIVRDNLNLQNH